MYEYKATLKKIVDGDTIGVIIDLGFKIATAQRIRFAKINTPEIFRVSKDSEEYRKGIAAKQYVERRLSENDKAMILQTEKHPGKWGRYIATILLNDSDTSLNDELVSEGLASFV